MSEWFRFFRTAWRWQGESFCHYKCCYIPGTRKNSGNIHEDGPLPHPQPFPDPASPGVPFIFSVWVKCPKFWDSQDGPLCSWAGSQKDTKTKFFLSQTKCLGLQGMVVYRYPGKMGTQPVGVREPREPCAAASCSGALGKSFHFFGQEEVRG